MYKIFSNFGAISVVLSIFVVMVACDDLIVNDISDNSIEIISPAEGAAYSSGQKVLFWWNELDGAETYKVQIVTPTFDYPQMLVVDTITDVCNLLIELPSGDYQWRIQAMNSVSKTKFFPASFFLNNK